jgi:hypothetical protein
MLLAMYSLRCWSVLRVSWGKVMLKVFLWLPRLGAVPVNCVGTIETHFERMCPLELLENVERG